MSSLRETATIERSSPTDDAMHRLLTFYLANGYHVIESQRASGEPVVSGEPVASEEPVAAVDGANGYHLDDGEDLAYLRLERGRPGAGWWTSNMTKLHTLVDLEALGDCIKVTYQVETTGQWLNEVEQAFWRRELKWARRWVDEETDQPRDLRDEETRRAKDQTGGMRSTGLWGAMIVFMVIVLLGFLGVI